MKQDKVLAFLTRADCSPVFAKCKGSLLFMHKKLQQKRLRDADCYPMNRKQRLKWEQERKAADHE